MKRLLTNYETDNAILKYNKIDAILYDNKNIILDFNGNNVNIEELTDEELIADIKWRVAKDEGEEI